MLLASFQPPAWNSCVAPLQASRGEGGFSERSKSMDWAADEMVKPDLHLCGARDTLRISPRRSLPQITTGLKIEATLVRIRPGSSGPSADSLPCHVPHLLVQDVVDT